MRKQTERSPLLSGGIRIAEEPLKSLLASESYTYSLLDEGFILVVQNWIEKARTEDPYIQQAYDDFKSFFTQSQTNLRETRPVLTLDIKVRVDENFNVTYDDSVTQKLLLIFKFLKQYTDSHKHGRGLAELANRITQAIQTVLRLCEPDFALRSNSSEESQPKFVNTPTASSSTEGESPNQTSLVGHQYFTPGFLASLQRRFSLLDQQWTVVERTLINRFIQDINNFQQNTTVRNRNASMAASFLFNLKHLIFFSEKSSDYSHECIQIMIDIHRDLVNYLSLRCPGLATDKQAFDRVTTIAGVANSKDLATMFCQIGGGLLLNIPLLFIPQLCSCMTTDDVGDRFFNEGMRKDIHDKVRKNESVYFLELRRYTIPSHDSRLTDEIYKYRYTTCCCDFFGAANANHMAIQERNAFLDERGKRELNFLL